MFALQLLVIVVLSLASLRLLHSDSRKAENIGLACAALTLALLAYVFVGSDFSSAVSAERH